MKIRKEKVYGVLEKDYDKFAANFIKQKLLSFVDSEVVNVALSGGSTPLPILKLLREEKLDWAKYNFFLVDERVVSVESSESNFKNIDEVFYQFISSQSFPVIKRNLTADEMVEEYEKKLKKFLPMSKDGFPKFDLIVLGMGEDGHTASLYAKTGALEEKEAVVVKNIVPHINSLRITLTFPTIKASDLIIVLLKGSRKNSVFREVKSGIGRNYPIARVLNCNVNWIISK